MSLQNMSLNISKIGMPKYERNPTVTKAKDAMRTGIKRISNDKTGEELIISNTNTGEVVGGAAFHKKVLVDKTQFVKLYIQGVSALAGLSKTAGRVLEMIMSEVSKNSNKDEVYVTIYEAKNYAIPEAVFKRGLKELRLATEDREPVLFESIRPGWYFININYFFNGDRMHFIQTYEIAEPEPIISKIHPNQLTIEFALDRPEPEPFDD